MFPGTGNENDDRSGYFAWLTARGEKKARQKNLHNIHLIVADVNRLPFRDESIDYVVSRYTLHHTNLDESLSEVSRILKPGGRVFLRDIFAHWPKLEKYAIWQMLIGILKTALHTLSNGPGSGVKYLKHTFSTSTLHHMKNENRLQDGPSYRSAHRRWFSGCTFEKLRPAYLFWEGPAVKWKKPKEGYLGSPTSRLRSTDTKRP